MKIIQITSQSRRDFCADMECEHCKNIDKGVSGYDDANFHQNVIPEMKCKSCGKSSPKDYKPRGTKYPEGQTI